MNCMWLCIKGARFLSLSSFNRLPVVHITFWFNAYSIINLFSLSDIFVKRISGLGGDFAFNYISLNTGRVQSTA